MSAKELILATSRYAQEDRKKSWRLLITGLILMVLAYAGAILPLPLALRIVCSILAGLIVVRVFIMYHDYLHKSILQRSPVAEFIFKLFGWFILAPMSIWRRSHDHHHAHNSKLYTSSIGSYPIVTKEDFLKASKKERFVYLMVRHPLTIAFGYFFAFLFGMTIRSLVNGGKKHIDSLYAMIFHYAIGAAIWISFGWVSFLLGFLLPAMISSAMGAYLFYAQHNFPEAQFSTKEEWDFAFAALKSSSYMKMNKLMHWFTGNIGYHHIHHINSKIPFYRLPEVYHNIKELQNPGITKLTPGEIIKCFRLKVWDPETRRLVGMKEIRKAAAARA